MHCKACDAPMSFTYIDGTQELETCCGKCKHEAFRNEPEDFYNGLWLNRNGHPSHVVASPVIIELEEAHAARETELAGDTASLS